MLAQTTTYLMEIQQELEASRQELYRQNKDLECVVAQRTHDLQKSVQQLQREVQERRKAEEELAVVNNELNVLLYRSSHDFKGPICTAFGLLNLMQGKVEDAEAVQYLQMLQRPLHKLEGLTKATTTIADIRQNALNIEAVAVSELLDEVLTSLKKRFAANYPAVTVMVAPQLILHTDRYLLESILHALLENAMSYYRTLAAHRVQITVQPYYKQLKFIISDNGIGISPAYQPRVFEMFYRASERSYGSGLGLYLAKFAVAKLGGKIELKSKEGSSTRVVTTLPNL